MPLYRICKLHFTTAVHFGSDQGGSMLTSVQETFRADVLFSALFLTLLKAGEADTLLDAVKAGRLWFSDGMPFKENVLYLPKPVGQWHKERMDTEPSVRKKFKRLTWIPVTRLRPYMCGEADPDALQCSFGESFEQTRVTLRTDDRLPLPYAVSGYRFAEGCGLYVLVRADNRSTMDFFTNTLTMLATEGIGGKVSSGWGKFTVTVETVPEKLQRMLEDDTAPCQLLLSSAMPEENEIDAVLSTGRYMLARRGGYAFSEKAAATKKRTVFLLAAGATFPKRFRGRVEDVGINMPHPVWRCAMAGFVGVRL